MEALDAISKWLHSLFAVAALRSDMTCGTWSAVASRNAAAACG